MNDRRTQHVLHLSVSRRSCGRLFRTRRYRRYHTTVVYTHTSRVPRVKTRKIELEKPHTMFIISLLCELVSSCTDIERHVIARSSVVQSNIMAKLSLCHQWHYFLLIYFYVSISVFHWLRLRSLIDDYPFTFEIRFLVMLYLYLQGPIGLDGPRGYTVSVCAVLQLYSNNVNLICDLLIAKFW